MTDPARPATIVLMTPPSAMQVRIHGRGASHPSGYFSFAASSSMAMPRIRAERSMIVASESTS